MPSKGKMGFYFRALEVEITISMDRLKRMGGWGGKSESECQTIGWRREREEESRVGKRVTMELDGGHKILQMNLEVKVLHFFLQVLWRFC